MDGVIEIITGRERRRRWSTEEKLRILAETTEPGAAVRSVAARNGIVTTNTHLASVTQFDLHMRRGMRGLALQVQEGLRRDPHGGDLFIFRGRRGDLAKIVWHDGVGLSLYAKRLDRGRFVWPSASDGAISISPAQMAYMLEGIDWRNPQLTWRPTSAG
jgi:transposase